MTENDKDHIRATYERTGLRKTIKESDRIAVTAQATGRTVDEVVAVIKEQE